MKRQGKMTRLANRCRTKVSGALAIILLSIATLWGHAAQAAETTTYVLTDVQGTVLAREDAHGTTIATYDYRPYGKQQTGPMTAGPGYTGHVDDPDTGLVYMQARYYDPLVGRFLSPDPVSPNAEDVLNFNRYAYANNSPVVNYDPDGRQSTMDAAVWAGVYQISQQGQEGIDQVNQINIGQAEMLGLVANIDGAGELVLIARGVLVKAGVKEAAELSPQALKGIRSLQKRISEHLEKIAEFKKSPTTRPGMENLSEQEIKRQQQERIAHLESEIRTFTRNIEKLKHPNSPPPTPRTSRPPPPPKPPGT